MLIDVGFFAGPSISIAKCAKVAQSNAKVILCALCVPFVFFAIPKNILAHLQELFGVSKCL